MSHDHCLLARAPTGIKKFVKTKTSAALRENGIVFKEILNKLIVFVCYKHNFFFFFFDSVLRPFQAFSLISRRINR